MDATDRSWVAKNAQVAVYTTDTHAPAAVQRRTIARLTDTLVILDDDSRWRRDTLKPSGRKRDTWSTTSSELLPLDDPRVAAARAGTALRNLGRTVEPWLAGKRTQVDDPAAALALLDQVAQAIADTRTRITRLAPPTNTED